MGKFALKAIAKAAGIGKAAGKAAGSKSAGGGKLSKMVSKKPTKKGGKPTGAGGTSALKNKRAQAAKNKGRGGQTSKGGRLFK